jgi:hypothetical protein
MTQSAASEFLVARTLHETIQVTHHDRESLRLRKFDYDIWNFVRIDRKHTLGRPTIIANINAMHAILQKSGARTGLLYLQRLPDALP